MISVIICSIDPAKFVAVEAMYRAAMGDEPWELIGIHDARSIAEAYNRGFARSRGETVIFSHDDVEVLNPDFPRRITGHVARFDMIGVAGTDCVIGARWKAAGASHWFGQIAHHWKDGKFLVNI